MHFTWKRSTYCSTGACVEVAFRKSSYSGGNGCVEVGHDDGRVLVRDSKNPDAEPVSFQRSEWMNTVLAPVMLDRLPSFIHEPPEGGYEWRGHTVGHAEQWLTFTAKEWEAFCAGVKAGEFNPPPRVEP
jgi:hypothetical protein